MDLPKFTFTDFTPGNLLTMARTRLAQVAPQDMPWTVKVAADVAARAGSSNASNRASSILFILEGLRAGAQASCARRRKAAP
ncbi:MAG: hypothetical protein AMXMBFR33_23450 [Candidatus Xenobia bacterium]